jgi:uncharacterized protein DUF4190
MRRCPTCNQAFEEDWLTFCTQDGTTLVDDSTPSTEPPPTVLAPEAAGSPVSSEQATWNLSAAEQVVSVPQWQPQSAAPVWQPPPPPINLHPPNKSLATAAMIVGILSVLCLGPIPAIFAIGLGGMSLSQINKEPARVGGKQMAWAGIITGGVSIVIYGALIILYIIVIAANA